MSAVLIILNDHYLRFNRSFLRHIAALVKHQPVLSAKYSLYFCLQKNATCFDILTKLKHLPLGPIV